MPRRALALLAAFAAAACASSAPVDPPDAEAPDAVPLALETARAAKEAPEPLAGENRSPSRVLAYVDGDVVTYRDVLLRIGPQLAVLDDEREKARLEQAELLDILQDRILVHAADEAVVVASRDEIDAERERRLADLRRSGGTLDAFLAERGMTRREYDEMIRRDLVTRKYLLAAIGSSGDPRVRVRPLTDTYVGPGDVRKYYDRHPERFREPAGARCRMVEVGTDLLAPDRAKAVAEAQARAEAALARLRGGEDWVPVYRELTRDKPDASHRELDGLFDARRGGRDPDWIAEFAFTQPKGTLSDVIRKGTTFYILRAEGAHPERVLQFEEVQGKVRSMLIDVRRRMATLEVELDLLDAASIRPESLKARLRDSLRSSRLRLIQEVGL